MSTITPIGVTQMVESHEDRALYASELAALAFDDAEHEARHAVTRGEVLERVTETFTKYDDKVLIKALRDGGRQSISLAWSAFNAVFEKLVAEKTAELLKEAK